MTEPHEHHALHKEEVLSILRSIAIFGGLENEHLEAVFAVLESTDYLAGETIFTEGSPPTDIYIVERGKVGIVCGEGAEAVELIEYGPGSCFGEMSVIGIQPHSAAAIAKSDCRLILLSRKALKRIHDEDLNAFSMLIMNIAREACRRLLATDKKLMLYAHAAGAPPDSFDAPK